MRKTLLASAAAISLLVATPNARAQFAVIDPANLVQNVQQVFQAIEEGIRTLRQIELAVQTVTGIDLSLTAALTDQLAGVQSALNDGAALVFEQTESLEQRHLHRLQHIRWEIGRVPFIARNGYRANNR